MLSRTLANTLDLAKSKVSLRMFFITLHKRSLKVRSSPWGPGISFTNHKTIIYEEYQVSIMNPNPY